MTDMAYDVTLYTQPGCGPCRATKRALDKAGADYTAVDVTTEPGAKAHLEREGWQGTPVVEVAEPGGEVVAAWQGLRMPALTALTTPGGNVAAHDMRPV